MNEIQNKVRQWSIDCFGEKISNDKIERNHRFLEESLELVQSLGCTKDECYKLVDYVFSRSVGEPTQEVGGTFVTLAALCNANDINLEKSAETEVSRITQPETMEKIRVKQANKPKNSPLPQNNEYPLNNINTDNADAYVVMEQLIFCAEQWEGDARLVGNIRARDIIRAANYFLDNN